MTVDPVEIDGGPMRVPGFRRLLAAMSVSSLGTFLQLAAAPWLMLELTGSPLWVSLVVAALMVPRLLLTIPAGAMTDALDRRTMVTAGQVTAAIGALAFVVMTASGTTSPVGILVASAIGGIGVAGSVPGMHTLMAELVPRPLTAGVLVP